MRVTRMVINRTPPRAPEKRVPISSRPASTNTGVLQRQLPAQTGAVTHIHAGRPRILLCHRRFYLHFTPTYGSWMNLVERWLSALTTKKLQRSSHNSVKEIAADITNWVKDWNKNPIPFVWHKTADEILDRPARYCNQINPTQ